MRARDRTANSGRLFSEQALLIAAGSRREYSAAPADVYVALRVHDTKITLLRLRAPPPRPPPAPVAASSTINAVAANHRQPTPPSSAIDSSAALHKPTRRNAPRPLPPARERALRRRIARIACLTATRFVDTTCFLDATCFLDTNKLPDLPLAPTVAVAHADVVADADALLARLAAAD